MCSSSMKVKCGRVEFDLNENDIIFDNGACYQITTRKVRKDFGHVCNAVLSQIKAKKLIKEGKLMLTSEEMKYITSEGKEIWYRYYKISE